VLEVRPPVRFDKGAGIAAFLEGVEVDTVMYVGDDVTDIDAFRGLTRLVEEGRIERAIRVGVNSPEAPAAVIGEADVVVDGTAGVAELLAALVADS
jgi:trehalose 6-phosphate phosphatase